MMDGYNIEWRFLSIYHYSFCSNKNATQTSVFFLKFFSSKIHSDMIIIQMEQMSIIGNVSR